MSYPPVSHSAASYPPRRYFHQQGEISAAFRPAAAEADFTAPPFQAIDSSVPQGTEYRYLSTAESTGGQFGLYRVDLGPEPGGAGTHFHKTISESFFILSGTMRLFDGARWIDATAGDYLYVPVGGLHAFRNESGEPVSMLMLFTPGAPREGYFEGITEVLSMSEQQRAAFLAHHDSYFLTPSE